MSEARDKMVSALREVVVPTLRDMGFRGSFPHFRRERGDQLDLLVFQFSQWGGSFVVELGYCPASGYRSRTGNHYAPDRVRVHHLHFQQRLRLGSVPGVTDYWFQFEPDSPSIYTDTALAVLPLLQSRAEHFWQTHELPNNRNA